MTRFTKGANGNYIVNGHGYDILSGSRAQVWHGTAYKTSGGLKKTDLMQNKAGRIVSRSKHNTAKKDNRLVKAGYGTKKGTFGFVKLGVSKSSPRSKSRGRSRKSKRGGMSSLTPSSYNSSGGTTSRRGGKHRGGMSPLNPSAFSGSKGPGTSDVNLQFVAGNAN